MELQKLSEWAQKVWNGWELRGLILLSLFLQILLVIGGLRRKDTAGILIGFITWLAYLSADSVAILTLGDLSRVPGGSESNSTSNNNPNPNPKLIPAFWATILLVHLGGPETISAYSMEDNELWLRHLLTLATQAVCAIYVMFKSRFKDPLIFVAIPIFVAGIIKYGERIWVLRLASSKEWQNLESEEMNKLRAKFQWVDGRNIPSNGFIDMTIESFDERLEINNIIPEAKYLHESHLLFRMLKILFVEDVALNDSCHLATYKILHSKTAIEAFKLTEVELGFMYDALYTKATTFHWPRILVRSVCFLSSASALLVFSFMATKSDSYDATEIIISYILLIGAVILEIHSVIFLLLSDWSMLWLSKQRKPWANSIYLFVRSCSLLLSSCLNNHKRWKRCMAQHEPVNARFTGKGYGIIDCFRVAKQFLKKLQGSGNIQSWVDVDNDLKKLIFNHLLDKRSRYSSRMLAFDHGEKILKEILAERGQYVLGKERCRGKLGRAIIRANFHGSLLMWHIATDICHHDDKNRGGPNHEVHPSCRMSRILSNYMMYLLGDCPAILPKGFDIRAIYEASSNHISEFSWFWRSETDPSNRWDSVRFSEITFQKIRSEKSYVSVLPDGRDLALSLQSLVLEDGWENERKWKMICEVWTEILAYAAINCGWKEHANALTRGGELITHVRLLMVHLGLSEQCETKSSYYFG